MLRKLIIFSFLSLTLSSSTSLATDFNYEGYPVGERAAGMGGAYTALSNTGEGSYYNPAGLAFANYSTVSLSANIYQWTKGDAKNAISIGGETASMPLSSMNIIPTSTIYLYKFNFWFDKKKDDDKKRNAFAVSVYVPDFFAYAGDVELTTSNSYVSQDVTDRTLLIGPSYARQFTDNFSLGVSLFYLVRSFDRDIFYRAEAGTTFSQGYAKTEYTYGGLYALLGAKLKLPHNFHIGATFRPWTIETNDGGSLYSSAVTTVNNATTSNNEYVSKSVDVNLTPPFRFTGGIGYEDPGKFTISGDVLFYLPHTFTEAHDRTGVFPDVRLKQEFTVNGKLGGEYYVHKAIPLRFGAFTNFSSAPTPQTGTANTTQINYYGGTFSIGYEREHTTCNLGAQYSYGAGKSLDYAGISQDFNLWTLSVLLAGSYRF